MQQRFHYVGRVTVTGIAQFRTRMSFDEAGNVVVALRNNSTIMGGRGVFELVDDG